MQRGHGGFSPISKPVESPDEKFAQLVKRHSGWIPYRPAHDFPILAQCAYLKKTSYIRILIAHGADADDAIKELKEVSADDAVELLRQVANEKK